MLLMMLSNKESNGYASNCYFFKQIGFVRCGYGVLVIVNLTPIFAQGLTVI